VRQRDAYNPILKRKLFGAAGAFNPEAKPEAPPPAAATTTEETSLPLKLYGTSVLEGSPTRAAAIIEVKNEGKGAKTFYPDDEVMSNVYLREVRPASVVLENRNQDRLELLQIDWAPGKVSAARSAPQTALARAVSADRPSLITLDRADIAKRLEDEYARVASTLNVSVVTGNDGKVQGITTDNIEQYPIAQELGFRNGDVLVSVNNEPVTSREEAVNIVRKYEGASIFRVGILRGGQMQYLTYRVR
jgi:type II secretory pathway component PulC